MSFPVYVPKNPRNKSFTTAGFSPRSTAKDIKLCLSQAKDIVAIPQFQNSNPLASISTVSTGIFINQDNLSWVFLNKGYSAV